MPRVPNEPCIIWNTRACWFSGVHVRTSPVAVITSYSRHVSWKPPYRNDIDSIEQPATAPPITKQRLDKLFGNEPWLDLGDYEPKLVELWADIQRRGQDARPPALIHEDLDLTLRSVRDLLTHEDDRVVVDGMLELERIPADEDISIKAEIISIPKTTLSVPLAAQNTAKRPMSLDDILSFRAMTTTALSPDGRWLAYASNETKADQYEIYVRPFPAGAGRWQVSRTGGDWPRWSRDGKELFFANRAGSMFSAEIRTSPNLAASVPKGATEKRGGLHRSAARA